MDIFDANPAPLVVDEIQYSPSLLRHLKTRLDAGRKPGAYDANTEALPGSRIARFVIAITADDREARSGVVALGTMDGVDLTAQRQAVGDYRVDHRVDHRVFPPAFSPRIVECPPGSAA